MEKRKPRAFTLTAGILNLICAALTMVSAAYSLLLLIRWIGLDALFTTMGFAYIILGMLGTAILVLSILVLAKVKRGIAITLFVFDVVLALLYVYSILTGGNIEAMVIVVLAMYVVSAVFLMVDITKKQYAKVVAEEQAAPAPAQDSAAEKLKELQAMKDNGVITEEEYKELREKTIEKYYK